MPSQIAGPGSDLILMCKLGVASLKLNKLYLPRLVWNQNRLTVISLENGVFHKSLVFHD